MSKGLMNMSKRTWMRGSKLNFHAPGTGFKLIILALTQVPVAIKKHSGDLLHGKARSEI